jgi:hypothetical protein
MRRALAITLFASTLLHASSGYAIDSYRYLHVSIETPWMIFLFLLVAVFVPFVLMVVLMWRVRRARRTLNRRAAIMPMSWLRVVLASMLMLALQPAAASPTMRAPTSNGAQILEQFSRQQPSPRHARPRIADHERQVIMFSIGAVLLLLLISTASVGIAVAVFGKPLFLVHMILAGLTVTVAIVHVIVGVVWFFPF